MAPLIFTLTFFIEEIAIAACAYLIAVHRIDHTLGFFSLYLGIFLSDIFIYLLGYLIARSRWIQNYADVPYYQAKVNQCLGHGFWTTIIISRVVPGALIPIFLILGFTKTNLYKVSFVTFCVTGIYTAVALYVLLYMGFQLSDFLGYEMGVALSLSFVIYLLRHRIFNFFRTQYSLARAPKAQPWPPGSHQGMPDLDAPRSLRFFERLPMAITYLPVVIGYLFYSVRFRSLSAPLAANPGIENSGLCGESKSKILSSFPSDFSYLIPRSISFTVSEATTDSEVLQQLLEQKITLPVVAKPDIGYMSRGVELISNSEQLSQYIEKFPKEQIMILQEYIATDGEAGIFYARRNSSEKPIVKIALTYFPFVVGDGHRSVGMLIKQDPRFAHFIASFSPDVFDHIPNSNEIFRLKLSGSTQDGSLHTCLNIPQDSQLIKTIEALSQSLFEFWIGRFDVKFESVQALVDGQFKILELNGAAGEDLTAWDIHQGIAHSYKTLFKQLRLLFEIGSANRKRGCSSISGAHLLKAYIEQESLLFRLTRAQYNKHRKSTNPVNSQLSE